MYACVDGALVEVAAVEIEDADGDDHDDHDEDDSEADDTHSDLTQEELIDEGEDAAGDDHDDHDEDDSEAENTDSDLTQEELIEIHVIGKVELKEASAEGRVIEQVESTSLTDVCHVKVTCGSTKLGEELHIVGSCPELGAWDVAKSVKLNTTAESFPLWTADVQTPAQGSKFKVIKVKPDGVDWECIEGNRLWPTCWKEGIIFGTL